MGEEVCEDWGKLEVGFLSKNLDIGKTCHHIDVLSNRKNTIWKYKLCVYGICAGNIGHLTMCEMENQKKLGEIKGMSSAIFPLEDMHWGKHENTKEVIGCNISIVRYGI